MIIAEKRNKTIEFGCLYGGDLFRYQGDYYIKTEYTLAVKDNGDVVTAINLDDGEGMIFKAHEVVEVVSEYCLEIRS